MSGSRSSKHLVIHKTKRTLTSFWNAENTREALRETLLQVCNKDLNLIAGHHLTLKDGSKVGEDAAKLDSENKGFQMLVKMGWAPPQEQVEPIISEIRLGRRGLGMHADT